MRRIVLDTETTGLEVTQGHRIIEIACVELFDRRPTGRNFHRYLNPEREIDEGAEAVHGLSAEFLSDKPRFAEVADELLTFVTGAFAAVFQPLAFQPWIHSVMPFCTYCESVCRITRLGRFRTESASITAVSSMRLLVVDRSPPKSSRSLPSKVSSAPQPPGPGLPLQAPSVKISTALPAASWEWPVT